MTVNVRTLSVKMQSQRKKKRLGWGTTSHVTVTSERSEWCNTIEGRKFDRAVLSAVTYNPFLFKFRVTGAYMPIPLSTLSLSPKSAMTPEQHPMRYSHIFNGPFSSSLTYSGAQNETNIRTRPNACSDVNFILSATVSPSPPQFLCISSLPSHLPIYVCLTVDTNTLLLYLEIHTSLLGKNSVNAPETLQS